LYFFKKRESKRISAYFILTFVDLISRLGSAFGKEKFRTPSLNSASKNDFFSTDLYHFSLEETLITIQVVSGKKKTFQTYI